MEKIETDERLKCSKLFDAAIDKQKGHFEEVCKDADGNLVLHISGANNGGNNCSESNEYFSLTDEEYLEYLEKARENNLVGWLAYRKLRKEMNAKDGGTDKPISTAPAGKITSFEVVTLTTSGMRGSSVREFVMKNGRAVCSDYGIRYRDGGEERVLEEQAVIGEDEALKLFNDCKLLSWNGFHGAHPKGVLDGTMFRLEAVVNGGQKIYADGSQNFPKQYRDFTDGIYQIFKKAREEAEKLEKSDAPPTTSDDESTGDVEG